MQDTPAALQDFYMHEFWRFVYVQQEVAKFAQTFIDFPPQQTPASFNVEAIVAQVKEQIANTTATRIPDTRAPPTESARCPSSRDSTEASMATNAVACRPAGSASISTRNGLDSWWHTPHGIGRFYPEERPLREERVEGFWIDRHPVTNQKFSPFSWRRGT